MQSVFRVAKKAKEGKVLNLSKRASWMLGMPEASSSSQQMQKIFLEIVGNAG